MILENIGKKVTGPVETFVGLSTLFVETLKVIFTEKGKGRRLLLGIIKKQILFTGFDAMPVITITSLLIGMVTIIEVITQLPTVGGESYMGSILVIVVLRELGPLLTAFIIIGRSGTAISTEIGNMMVGGEVQAIENMGINPLRFIIMPRLFGVTIAMVCLAIYFDLSAIVGGFVFARLTVNYPLAAYVADITSALGFFDLMAGIIKCFIFGVIIAIVCAAYGFSVKVATTEVPQATTKAVVTCIYLCFVANCIITAFFFI
ncbi:MAG: ABC transporter permease [Pseudomonadota bacterium]